MAEGKKLRVQTVEKEPIPQDGGYGWVVLAGCFAISFLVDGLMYSFGMIIPEIQKQFNSTESKVNQLSGLYSGSMFLSGPIVAGLSNSFGVRAVVIGGAAVTALTFATSAYAPSLSIMYVLYGIIGGVATGCCYIGSIIIVCQYFDKLKGLATGIVMSGSGFGSFLIPVLVTLILKYYDWKTYFIVAGGIILQCCIMGAFFRPVPTRLVATDENATETPLPPVSAKAVENNENLKVYQSTVSISVFQSRNSLTKTKPVFVSNTASDKKLNVTTFAGSMISIGNFNQTLNVKTLEDEFVDQPWHQRVYEIFVQIVKDVFNVKLLFQNLKFFLLVMCNFCCFNALFIPYIYIPKHALHNNLTDEQSGNILSIVGIVNIPFRLAFGAFADRRIISPVNLNTIAIGIAASSCFLVGHLTSFYEQAVFGIIFAIGTAGMNILPNNYLNDTVGSSKFNNALGIVNLFRGFACFLGPSIGGIISEYFDNYLYAFWFAGLAFTMGAVCSLICGILVKLNDCCQPKTKEPTEAELDPLKKADV